MYQGSKGTARVVTGAGEAAAVVGPGLTLTGVLFLSSLQAGTQDRCSCCPPLIMLLFHRNRQPSSKHVLKYFEIVKIIFPRNEENDTCLKKYLLK